MGCASWAWAWVGYSRGGSWFFRGWSLPMRWHSRGPSLGVSLRPKQHSGRKVPQRSGSDGRWVAPVIGVSEWGGPPRYSSWFSRGWSLPIPFHCDLYWFPLFWAHQCRLAAAAVFRPTSPLPVANPPSRASDVDREWRFRRASHHVSGFLNLRPCVSCQRHGAPGRVGNL